MKSEQKDECFAIVGKSGISSGLVPDSEEVIQCFTHLNYIASMKSESEYALTL
jgi:hypothetical protein